MRTKLCRSALQISILVIFIVPTLVWSQSTWLRTLPSSGLRLETQRAWFDKSLLFEEFSFGALSARATATVQVSPTVQLVAELPFAFFETNDQFYDLLNERTIGNPYLGVRLRKHSSSGLNAQAGLRIPLLNEHDYGIAPFYGTLITPEIAEAFVRSATTFSGSVGYNVIHLPTDRHPVFAGSVILRHIILGDPSYQHDDGEDFLQIDFESWLATSWFSVGAGFSIHRWLTHDDLQLYIREVPFYYVDDTFTEIGLILEFSPGPVSLGVNVRAFSIFDETFKDVLEATYGAYISYDFNSEK